MLEETEGTVQKIAGRIQDTVGAAMGDSSVQAEGKARQAAGTVQQTYGEALNQVRETAVANPLATIAAVAGIGFVLGALWARN